MKKELHLIILWENARRKEKKILSDIQKKFQILETFEVEWSKKIFSKNLTRFYGVKLKPKSGKEKETGNGKFLLITLLDKNPKYDWVETSRGSEYINTNIFQSKKLYRSWTNDGHKVHTTNTPIETEHDLTLLIGKNTKDYLSETIEPWSKKVKSYQNDLVGANGWKDLKEFFYTLNSTMKYIVLRNYEYLPGNYVSEEHGDIDLLVENFENSMFIANATKVFDVHGRVHCFTIINGEKVLFDFRHKEDDYYCHLWERDLLDDRQLHENGFYIPEKKAYFYSLIYHALIHKRMIAKDYYTKLGVLFEEIFPKEVSELKNYKNPFDLYFVLLKNHMAEKGYFFVCPKDKSVFYDEKRISTDLRKEWIEKNYGLKRLKTACINKKTSGGFLNFTGYTKDSEKVFVKCGGIADSVKKEYFSLKLLHKYSNIFFPKPLYYRYDGEQKVFISEHPKGKPLDSLLKGGLKGYDTEKILKQLLEIAKILNKNKLIHRDIKPDNILCSETSDISIIDFQFALSKEEPYLFEAREIRRNCQLISGLGGDFKKGSLFWDDAFSFSKVVKKIGVTPENKKEYGKVLASLQKMEGTLFAKYKSKRKFRKILAKLLALFCFNRSTRKKIRLWGKRRKVIIYRTHTDS